MTASSRTKSYSGTHPMIPRRLRAVALAGLLLLLAAAPTARAGLLVGNIDGNNVLSYDDSGRFLGVVASGGGLSLTRGLGIGSGGDLFVASALTNQVLRYSSTTGAFEGVFASGGGLSFPYGVAFGPGGDLFVDSSGTNQVLRYSGTTGAFEGVFASGGGLNTPLGLAFGLGGDLFVANTGNGSILRFDGSTGDFDGVFASGGPLINPEFLVFTSSVPEPSSLILYGIAGLTGLGYSWRRRKLASAS